MRHDDKDPRRIARDLQVAGRGVFDRFLHVEHALPSGEPRQEMLRSLKDEVPAQVRKAQDVRRAQAFPSRTRARNCQPSQVRCFKRRALVTAASRDGLERAEGRWQGRYSRPHRPVVASLATHAVRGAGWRDGGADRSDEQVEIVGSLHDPAFGLYQACRRCEQPGVARRQDDFGMGPAGLRQQLQGAPTVRAWQRDIHTSAAAGRPGCRQGSPLRVRPIDHDTTSQP